MDLHRCEDGHFSPTLIPSLFKEGIISSNDPFEQTIQLINIFVCSKSPSWMDDFTTALNVFFFSLNPLYLPLISLYKTA